ncbi:hypothetical protein [Gilvibacter sediminis]|uniref:hypothetical protein n=1 Tax=Gilvibacter sediminis TaxID=379071 RepID=UPI002350AF5E|nr:hypothetical protein [Gilvibacter sediminis]MDC7998038.1 hypothetical protein [Gilvibacter sediminis]
MNLKNILAQIGSYVLIGISVLGVIVLYAGFGGRGKSNDFGGVNYYFVAVGVALLLPMLIYILKTKFELDQWNNNKRRQINKLIKHGDQLTVNLDELEVQTNSYLKEIEVGSGYNTRMERIPVNHNVLLISAVYRGQPINYKVNIDMDPTKLKMYLALKKETVMYVDPKDPNNNHLDLSFLELN